MHAHCWGEMQVPVGDHLHEADGDKDGEHAAAGRRTPRVKGKRVVELCARQVDHLLPVKEKDPMKMCYTSQERESC